jgi:hypothetical protein
MGRIKAKKSRRARNPLPELLGGSVAPVDEVTACPRCGRDDEGEIGGLGCCGQLVADCSACSQDGWTDDDEPINPQEPYEWYVATGERFVADEHMCA